MENSSIMDQLTDALSETEPQITTTAIKPVRKSKGRHQMASGATVAASNYDSEGMQMPELSNSDEPRAILLVNEEEKIEIKDSVNFAKVLGGVCPQSTVKVISIVGKTGDGKSHTLNQAFFQGREVFQTSNNQNACTMGVWAAFFKEKSYLLLDTEGLLGNSANPNRQKRLLLKLFAISDVVVYRTMAERLHSDIFTFLADASDAFGQHFKTELERLVAKNFLPQSTCELGPSIIIFQETKHTETLPDQNQMVTSKNQCTMDDFLHEQFRLLGRNVNSFSTLRYQGSRTRSGQATDFVPLVKMINGLLNENFTRSSRRLDFVFRTLFDLNRNFCSDLPSREACTFVEEYFTCSTRCLSCQCRCSLGLGHIAMNLPHKCEVKGTREPKMCQYERSLDNKQYFCTLCKDRGLSTLLVPKFLESNDNAFTGVVRYLWSGFLLECKDHGVLYRARANWSNNPVPEHTPNVEHHIVHVWPGEQSLLKGTHPVGQIMIDGLNNVSTQLGRIAWPHARKLGDYIADSVAPDYWTPNALIMQCSLCKRKFADNSEELVEEPSGVPIEGRLGGVSSCHEQVDDGFKHHCRSCGKGVCSVCSVARMPVPERGYMENVRVCDKCYADLSSKRGGPTSHVPVLPQDPDAGTPFGRKVFETLSITGDYIKPLLLAPKDMVKTYARPDYWQPDEECKNCPCCDQAFGPRRAIHHCRQCGRGVCNPCSSYRQPIPLRGLDQPCRICDECSGATLRRDQVVSSSASVNGGVPLENNVGIRVMKNNGSVVGSSSRGQSGQQHHNPFH